MGGGRGDVVDRVDVGRGQRDRRRPRRQRPPPPGSASLTPPVRSPIWAATAIGSAGTQNGRGRLATTAGGTTPRSGRRSPTGCPTPRRSATPGRCGPGASSTSAPTPSPPTSSSAGVVEQDKVAQYLYNGPEYLESVFAAFKAGLAVVNTNYRYTPDELDLPLGQRRRRRRRLPRRVRRAVRDGPRSIAADPHVAVGRRRLRALPGMGDAVRSGDVALAGTDDGPVGPSRRSPPAPLHRRHDRHAQGSDVAPGRPVPGPRPAQPPPAPAARRRRRARPPNSTGRARRTCRLLR